MGVLFEDGRCRFVVCGTEHDDPQIEGSWIMGYEVGRCCLLRTLLSYNGKSTSEGGTVLRPDLAAGLPTITNNGLTWTFRLKRGIHFAPPLQDVEITSPDFVRSIERLLGAPPPHLPDVYGDELDYYLGRYLDLTDIVVGAGRYVDDKAAHISGLETPDDHTLVFHLTKPYGLLASMLSLPSTAPIPPNPFDPKARFGVAEGHARFYLSYLVASGPYMFEGANKLDFSRPPDEQMPAAGDGPEAFVLVRNPSWDPATDPLRAAEPNRIVLTRVANPQDAEDLVRSGALDLVLNWEPSPHQLGTGALGAGTSSYTAPADTVRFLQLNPAIPPLDDAHVRKAINFAIPRQQLLPVYEKDGILAVPATHVGLDSQEDNLLVNFDPYHAAAGDLQAARREMAASRYDTNHDGQCDASACQGLLAWVHKGEAENEKAALIMGRSLHRIGIDLDAQVVGDDQFNSTYADYPHAHLPIRFDGWFKDLTSGATYFPFLFGSPQTGLTESYNSLLGASAKQLHGWGYTVDSVPNVDDRILNCLRLAFALQVRCWADLDQYLMTQVVTWVPLVSVTTGRDVSARVKDVSYDQSSSTPLPSLDRIVLAQEPSPPSSPPVTGPVPGIPEGVYRTTITKADLFRFDPHYDPGSIDENTGTTKIYLRNGWFEFVQTADHPIFNVINVGTYRGEGNRVGFTVTGPEWNAISTPPMRWRLDGGALHFRFLGCGNLNTLDPHAPHLCDDIKVFYEAHPWVKVG